MDEHTYSDSKAAKNLAKILNAPECEPFRGAVQNILSRWFQYSSAIMVIQDTTVCRGTLDMWRSHFLSRLENSRFPKNVKSHAANVIVMQYRRCKVIIDARAKEMIRQKRIGTIEDGFGSVWSVQCPECGRKSMSVVRPGKAQCTYCG